MPAEPAPGPLEEFAASFDDLFDTLAQRRAFRRYLEGLLPAEQNKTLIALANTEPVVGTRVFSLWADEVAYYPLEVESYTPAYHFEGGKADAAFRTKLKIACQFVERSVGTALSFRAVVVDSFYGEDEVFEMALDGLAACATCSP